MSSNKRLRNGTITNFRSQNALDLFSALYAHFSHNKTDYFLHKCCGLYDYETIYKIFINIELKTLKHQNLWWYTYQILILDRLMICTKFTIACLMHRTLQLLLNLFLFLSIRGAGNKPRDPEMRKKHCVWQLFLAKNPYSESKSQMFLHESLLFSLRPWLFGKWISATICRIDMANSPYFPY